MALDDRPYWRGANRGETFGGDAPVVQGPRWSFPRPGPMVLALLLANAGVFILQVFLDQGRQQTLTSLLAVTAESFWQVWRYLTFQFLHGSPQHIAMNMLGLYMLGTPLEKQMGGRRFLRFYLVCGAAAGRAYVIVSAAAALPAARPIVGASGGVFGIILACAILMPEMRVVLFIFPMSMRLLATIVFVMIALVLVQSFATGQVQDAMSDMAHLGGAAAAGVWLWLIPRLQGRFASGRHRASPANPNSGAWQRRMKALADEQARVDEVLKKIHDKGIASLSAREKKTLQDATRRQREQERQINKL